jgi:hypothetical protein
VRSLRIEHVKHLLLGHWGTTPGQNFIYVHLNRVIKKFDLDMIYMSGPGHGTNMHELNPRWQKTRRSTIGCLSVNRWPLSSGSSGRWSAPGQQECPAGSALGLAGNPALPRPPE